MCKFIWLACCVVLVNWSLAQTTELDDFSEAYRPKLFKQFGDHVNTPDGLAQDKAGNIYLAAPNFVDPSYPGVIMKMDKRSGRWSIFVSALIHPDTGRGAPMGMEFGADGHLYYCDNQYFFNPNYKSRVMRVVIDDQGEPVRVEPVVENVKLANAIRVRGNAIYFTDTLFDLEGQHNGGVYRVPLSAFAERPVRLLPKAQWEQDPYCLGVTVTQPLPHRKDPGGADGLCFDRQGHLYTCNFGDGNLYMLRLLQDGTYDRPKTIFYNPQRLPCADGLAYYAPKNWIFVVDSERNAILYWDVNTAELKTLWRNGDSDGATGLLDQPCEVMVWGDKLLVSNMDMSCPGLLNQNNDPVHSLSVIQLPQRKRWSPRRWFQ